VASDEVITVVATARPGQAPIYDVYAVKRDGEAGARIAAGKGTGVTLSTVGGEGFRRGQTLP
jgi:hypothetical protein